MFSTDPIYKDRKDAGEKLAQRLDVYKDEKPLVLGIPRGGVEVGYYVARQLNAELSVIVTKKVPHPRQPEYGIGALAEDGSLYLDESVQIAPDILDPILETISKEITRRVADYRHGKPLPDMKGRTVIIVDDGIATGVTVAAAIILCRNQQASKIIVAAPVSGKGYAEEILSANEIIILHQPETFYGVGQAYEDFSQLTDEDVWKFLKKDNGKKENSSFIEKKNGVKSLPLKNSKDLDPLMERIGDSRLVLLGEASHGTHEYYTWRTAISKRLIEEKGFNFIAVEGDWPDCYRVNRYIKGYENTDKTPREILKSFNRWPTWMWANWEIVALISWLKDHNSHRKDGRKIGFYGLDVYSLWESMEELIAYLKKTDPHSAQVAEMAFNCFSGYQKNEHLYAINSLSAPCRDEVIQLLKEIRLKSMTYNHDPEAALNTVQNAHIAVEAENYYRNMVSFNDHTWNIRDRHMMDTLDRIMEFHGPKSKAIIWEHNTHVGDARYTDMEATGLFNVGQLARERYSENETVIVGFGSYEGSVMAGSEWGAPMREMNLPKAKHGSIEEVLHRKEGEDRLIIFNGISKEEEFKKTIPHRAVGVVYDPANEEDNYVPSRLSRRYDAFIYLDQTKALHPLHVKVDEGQTPETYPFEV